MKIDWSNPKKKWWFVNCLTFNFYRFFPFRDKSVWIFGAWEGMKYDDNARSLFEYVNENYPNIRCVWLTKTQKTVDFVRSLGYEAYASDSKEGKRFQIKAGVAFYTNGVMDFGLHPRIAGALVVSLWHGVGFKKTYNEKYSGFKLLVKRIMDKFFSWTYRNVTTGTSQYVLSQFRGTFSLPANAKMVITGQPRNDLFKKHLKKENVLNRLNIDFNKKIVLYMPTYRSNGLPADAMEKIVLKLYNDESLSKTLDDGNCIFLTKLHPMCNVVSFPRKRNFIVLNNGDVDSNQELLAVSDMLITDYSSCIVDFALQERPVIFYLPDHEAFISHSEPLFKEFFEICEKNSCSTIEDLCCKISNPSMSAVDSINALYEESSIKGSCYSENVYMAIKTMLES